MASKVILGETGISQSIENLAEQIVRANLRPRDTRLVGILTRGATIAKRLKKLLKAKYGLDFKIGVLDTRPFRDDLKMEVTQDRTDMDFGITSKNIILVDDVISTGRTVRAALDALMKNGRPKTIKTAFLVDLDHRELPITSDFVGVKIHTSVREKICVRLSELDGGADRAYITLNK